MRENNAHTLQSHSHTSFITQQMQGGERKGGKLKRLSKWTRALSYSSHPDPVPSHERMGTSFDILNEGNQTRFKVIYSLALLYFHWYCSNNYSIPSPPPTQEKVSVGTCDGVRDDVSTFNGWMTTHCTQTNLYSTKCNLNVTACQMVTANCRLVFLL